MKNNVDFLRNKFPVDVPQPKFWRVLTMSSHRDFASNVEAEAFSRELSAHGLFVDPTEHTLELYYNMLDWKPNGWISATYEKVAEHYGYSVE